MSDTLRILDSGLMSARWNVAMTATLAARHARGLIRSTLRLHRYPISVLIGHSQDCSKVVDVEYADTHAIEIARRVTGGGAVLMTPSMLAWEVVGDRIALGGDLTTITARICKGVAAGLNSLGAPAVYRAPSDIAVGERKIAGASGCTSGRSVMLQGTLLIDDDCVRMAAALRIPLAQLRATLTNLRQHLPVDTHFDRIGEAIVAGISAASDLSVEHDQVTDAERHECAALLREDLGTDAFVFGDTTVMTGDAA